MTQTLTLEALRSEFAGHEFFSVLQKEMEEMLQSDIDELLELEPGSAEATEAHQRAKYRKEMWEDILTKIRTPINEKLTRK